MWAFEPCDRVRGPERKGSQSQGLELVSIGSSESNVWPVWQYKLPAVARLAI